MENIFDKKTQKDNIAKAKRVKEIEKKTKERKIEEFQSAFKANQLYTKKVQAIREKRAQVEIGSAEGDELFFDAVGGEVEENLVMNEIFNDIEAKRIDLGRKEIQKKQMAAEARKKDFLDKRVASINTKGKHEDAMKRKIAVMKEIEEAIDARKKLNDPKVIALLNDHERYDSYLKRLESTEMKLFGEVNPPREVIISSRSNSINLVDQEKVEFHDVMRDKKAEKVSVFDIPSPKLNIRDQELHDAARKVKEQYTMMRENNLARSIIDAQKREEQKQKDKEMNYRERVSLRSKTAIQLKGKELFSECLADSQLILAQDTSDDKVTEYKELLQTRFLKAIESSIKPDSTIKVDDSYKDSIEIIISKAVDKLVEEIKLNQNSIDSLLKKERSWFNIPGKLYDSFAGMFHKVALIMGTIKPTAAEIFEEAAKYSNDMKQKIEKQQAIDNKRATGKGPFASLINNSRFIEMVSKDSSKPLRR